MNKIYYGIEIFFSQDNYDKIYNLLYIEGISTILEESGIIKFFLEENELQKIDELKNKLLELPSLSTCDIHVERLINHDWKLEWEKSIEPVNIKDKIIVYPSWKKNELKETEGKILIEIDPKMSFGTGHNETTQMMLEMMCDYVSDTNKYLLDYGCGTAVLAIAAIKLGIKNAVAIDIDEDSILNASEYIAKNNVEDSIKLYKANIDEIIESGFDIILANIDRIVILNNINSINAKLKPGGKLFITGILVEEEPGIIDVLSKNKFKLIEKRNKAEWIAFYAEKL
jgi:ribosomal protein L11 methyltransferase